MDDENEHLHENSSDGDGNCPHCGIRTYEESCPVCGVSLTTDKKESDEDEEYYERRRERR